MNIGVCSPNFAKAETMGQTHNPSTAIEANPVPMPVILPISGSDRRTGIKAERPAKRASWAKKRFEFPQLPPPRKVSPLLGWPKCSEEEKAACTKAAETIYRQLPLRQPAVLALTSPRDGDGKTRLMVGIAPELAKMVSGGILAVDANVGKPDLVSQLILPFRRTTTGPSLIYPTNHPGLNVLLPSTQNRGFDLTWLLRLRDDWSVVLVDMPSLEHPEATSLLCQCTGVYLAVRLGYTPRSAMAEAARLIPTHGSRLMGCLVVGEEESHSEAKASD
jgi:Mrp family chromosome partitioning ATPase